MQNGLEKFAYLLDLKGYWLHTPSIQRMMLIVCLALLPGLIASTLIYGPGVLINLLLAIAFGLGLELLFTKLKGEHISAFNFDASGAVIAFIFALSLPASLSWWMVLIGMSCAVVMGKLIYGGTGNNVFNPAMLGVSVLLVSFPSEMSHWYSTHWSSLWDAQSSATPFDHLQTQLRLAQMISEIEDQGMTGLIGASGHEWVNLSFLAGGLFLLYKKIIPWQIPCGVLLGLSLIALVMHGTDADRYPGVMFHLFGGATMLCAFFVATDPVTSPITAKARLIFALAIGVLIYVIRSWASHPEGVAFAILLMNACVPLLDYYTRPQAPPSA